MWLGLLGQYLSTVEHQDRCAKTHANLGTIVVSIVLIYKQCAGEVNKEITVRVIAGNVLAYRVVS